MRDDDRDWQDLLARRAAPGAAARTVREVRALADALANDVPPPRDLSALRARMFARLEREGLVARAAPAAAANDGWFSAQRFGLAASLVLALGVGILAVQVGPGAPEGRSLIEWGAQQVHARDPAAAAARHRARLEALGARVTVQAHRDGSWRVSGEAPAAAQLAVGDYLAAEGVRIDTGAGGRFSFSIVPSERRPAADRP